MSQLLQLTDDADKAVHGDAQRVLAEQVHDYGDSGPALWLIDEANVRDPLELMTAVRQQPSPAAYLQPILLLTAKGGQSSLSCRAADGAVSPESFDSSHWLSHFADLQRWIAELPDPNETDGQTSMRVLRHLASRHLSIEPMMTAQMPSGFVYPPLLPYFGGAAIGTLEILQFLETQQFLEAEFSASAYLCFHCRSAFLAFEETCKQCESADLDIQELVHHFRCGHVAPIDEYRNDDKLSCGKCGRDLKHIGVDYDKPSLIYHCRSCDHRFQEADVRTTCFACGRRTAPENQHRETINRFRLTPLGDNAARFGVESLFTHLLERDIGLVPWSVFQRFVHIEQSRIKRFGKTRSTLLFLSIDNMEQIYAQLGARAVELFEALSSVMAGIVRDTDVVTSREERFYLFLLAETGLENAEVPRERLISRLTEVMSANLSANPRLESHLLELTEDVDLEAQLQSMASRPRD
ncbi:hypothetical protein [Chromatocurvus halotolerans]|uniref:Thaumarchaeal output domain-containing protein n=1 Tax=Chromatocurvus halotolerans TaxID=1132028 RepID=A0A4R2KRA8_9GAMM|nr:hypothetical protein [Chromatocurvus halotolerans]TCO76293.1 hypothetical protein EV688_105256 [Chromatocurvus halotolerans]